MGQRRIPVSVLEHGWVARTPSTSLVIRRAKGFVRAGYSIVPLQSRGKAPLNRGRCNQPTTKWRDFLPYIKKHPGLNFGIGTGTASGIVVIDVDGEESEAYLRKLEAAHGPLPQTIG